MPLARRLNLRLGRNELDLPSRSLSVRKEISLPLNLLSTTNALSYDAPDLADARKALAVAAAAPSPLSPGSSCPSSASDHGSMPDSPSPPSLTDASSLENSPVLEHNHLSAYFPTSPKNFPGHSQGMLSYEAPPPAIPRRVPSHSKKEHERLARKRSLRSPNPALTSPRDIGSPTSPLTADLLGASMHQVVEKVDEEVEDDTPYMSELGLCKFSATDYQDEIGAMVWPSSSVGSETHPLSNETWI